MFHDLVSRLKCAVCCADGRLRSHVFTAGENGHIRDGVLTCVGCNAWYPVEDELLELVAAELVDRDGLACFCQRWRSQLASLGLRVTDQKQQSNGIAAQLKQREHFDWYADNSQQRYLDYAKTPFWTAVDRATFKNWRKQIRPGSWLLDIGCANGRSAFPLAEPGVKIVGFDISKKMVRQAIEQAKRAGCHGDRPPFAPASFDFALTYGVLHHLPNPDRSCRRIHEILKPGGVYFGSENNRTIFRGIFDLLMKLAPLWTEEAGAEPLISKRMIRQWHSGLPVQMRSRSRVFLPPHLLNLVGQRLAGILLPLTDALAGSMPGLRDQGGLILFEMHKAGDAHVAVPADQGRQNAGRAAA
jgi:SAM-dependent methyltransferase/uncharacterized protein YbaR (Trm112 family)